uniref:Uncharacterized protein n=1 Tax=Micrurus paraensis TaxID=1970185 RepID=A0A2D4KDR9_9SAUR
MQDNIGGNYDSDLIVNVTLNKPACLHSLRITPICWKLFLLAVFLTYITKVSPLRQETVFQQHRSLACVLLNSDAIIILCTCQGKTHFEDQGRRNIDCLIVL